MSISGMKTFFYENYQTVVNKVTNPLSESKFLSEGVLTPEEFILAGDMLVSKCPSWSWQAASSPKLVQKGLPPEKQYLITKNVPCMERVSAFLQKTEETSTQTYEEDDGEGGWTATHITANEAAGKTEEIPEIELEGNDDDEDLPEIDLDSLTVEDTSDKQTVTTDNVLKTRTYDLTISYDQFHQTPRMWLFGYSADKKPLSPEEILQDISRDHANKTVTTAQHPHLEITSAYIHPCKHAAVMKTLVQRIKDSGKSPRVDTYLFIFLKFLQSAIPTIQYDYTLEMDI